MENVKNVKEEVSKNLLHYRKRKRLTQKALAYALGVSHNTISQWESGTNSIDIDTLYRVCKILCVSINDMYGAYANALTEQYSKAEKKIIDDFRLLNTEGQEKIIEYIDDLKKSGKYIKSNPDGMADKKQA
jgi:repressor LexA